VSFKQEVLQKDIEIREKARELDKERSQKKSEKSWKAVTAKDHTADAAHKAFICDNNTHLFIAVIPSETGISTEIYFFTNLCSDIPADTVEVTPNILEREIIPSWNRIKTVKDINEGDAKGCGEKFCKRLLKDKSKKLLDRCDRMNVVWIYCKDKNISPLWEWIYTNEDFFWGDKYHIIRIPENCEFENSKFRINTFTFLLDGSCLPACDKCKKSKKSLKELLEGIVECNEIKFNSPEKFDDLEVLDCIHVGACEETLKKTPLEYKTKFLERLKRKPKFIFLNMFAEESSSTYAPLSEAIKSVPPNTWIDSSSLNVPEEFALDFIECFYETFKESLKNNNEAKIVEIIGKTREKIEKIEKNQEKLNSNAFWRLAYVVNGNPYTKFTRG
jgi:hypothetical protein